jgi:redox-sensitive bicupin YhaK (pirin superfamily)
MGFRHLRVINDDWIDPASGFGLHPHRDMEIFTFVSEGEVTHADSEGNESVMRPGRVQLMRAGTGIFHSEHNRSVDMKTHLHQIWIVPEERDLEPGYWEEEFTDADIRDTLHLLAGPNGSEAPLTIRQQAWIFAARPTAGTRLALPTNQWSHCWLQLVDGKGRLVESELDLAAGDGVAFEGEGIKEYCADEDTELLFFAMN